MSPKALVLVVSGGLLWRAVNQARTRAAAPQPMRLYATVRGERADLHLADGTRIRWRAGDCVMWDNRAVLHRGRPWDTKRYRRVMHRTTVAGDGPTVPDPVVAADAVPAV